MQDDLIERLRGILPSNIPNYRECVAVRTAAADAIARIAALEADNARLMGLVKEAGEALSFVADRAAKLKAGTDDWFELVEFEQVCRPTLAKIKEATDA